MRIVRPLRAAALAALCLGAPAQAPAGELEGAPQVIDGDTIRVQGETVRLFGVDAPELGQTCALKARVYDCGEVARAALLDLTAGARVVCRMLAGGPDAAGGEGRPGRCFAGGYDLSEGMAYTGWALAQREVSGRYAAIEDGARAAGRGLWRGRFLAPWAWRAGARLPEEGAAAR